MNTRLAGYCAAVILLSAVLLAAGCSGSIEDVVAPPAADKAEDTADNPRPSQPPAPPPPSPATVNEPDETQADVASDQGNPPVEPATVPPTATMPEPTAAKPQAAPTGQPSIRLSAGVALAQTLPTGTAMGFSVDYEFTEGRPNPSSPCFLVIEPAKGPPGRIKVLLNTEGTLQGFAVGLRPEHGPFEGHIEDARGNRLSDSLPLR